MIVQSTLHVDLIPPKALISLEHDSTGLARAPRPQEDGITPVELSSFLLQEDPPKHLSRIAGVLRSCVETGVPAELAVYRERLGAFGETLLRAALYKGRNVRISLARLYEIETSRESEVSDADTVDYLCRFAKVHGLVQTSTSSSDSL